MNNTFRILIFSLLLLSFNMLAGCRSLQEPVSPRSERGNPDAVSDIRKLESTALMVDGSRQKALGNWQQALLLFFEATQRDPRNDAAHFELAKIHAMQGQFADAMTFARNAAGIDPNNAYYQLLLADLFILTEDIPRAVEIYETLAGKHPENVDYQYQLANIYIQDSRYMEALDKLDHIEGIVGFVEEIALQKHKLLVETGQYERAIAEGEKLLQAFPQEPLYYELLGELYSQTGQMDKVRDIYHRLLEVEPGNPVAYLLIADYYQNTGDTSKALEYLQQAFGSSELDPESKARILYSLYMMAEEDEQYLDHGLVLCRVLVETHPQDPESYLIYGDFLNRKELHEQAREQFLEGLKLDPSKVEVWNQVLVLDNILQDYQSMKEHSQMALEYFFEQPLLFLFQAIANMGLKDYEEAAVSLEFGLGLSAGNHEMREQFLTLLGDTYHYLEDSRKSDSYYEQAISLNPQNATALNNFSYHLAERGMRLEDAEAMSRRAIELEAGNAAFYDTYGWIMFRMERYEEARYWIEKSINTYEGKSGTVLEHYGDVLYKLGQKEQAIQYWNKAFKTGEGSPSLERKVKTQTFYD